MAAVKAMSSYILKLYLTINNYTEYLTTYHAPHAALSISMDGCIEKGKDAVSGGCKYNSYGGTATGLATLADALSTIEYMCFDKKLCTTRELYDAVMVNWEGHEVLRQQILAKVPHFGNDDPYADKYMKWICGVYSDICGECHSVRSKVYKAGLYGASDHVAQATTHGRPLTAGRPANLWPTPRRPHREEMSMVLRPCSIRLAASTIKNTWMVLL